MTMDQFVGLVRQLLPFLGGLLIALGVSQTDSSTLIAKVGEVVGPLATVVGVIWSLVANSKKSILKSASSIPEVTQIKVTDKELADALPANVTHSE